MKKLITFALTIISMHVSALNVISDAEKAKLGVNIEWIKKPPVQVKVGEEFEVSWKVTGEGKTPHVNLHACPSPHTKGTCSKKDGRLDGAILQGVGNSNFSQKFVFMEADIEFGGKTEILFHTVGHVILDQGNGPLNIITETFDVKVSK